MEDLERGYQAMQCSRVDHPGACDLNRGISILFVLYGGSRDNGLESVGKFVVLRGLPVNVAACSGVSSRECRAMYGRGKWGRAF